MSSGPTAGRGSLPPMSQLQLTGCTAPAIQHGDDDPSHKEDRQS